MYLCPLCGMQYPPAEVPDNCNRCKRPLVLQGRFRIEISIDDTSPGGEDFEVTDLKTKGTAVLRELRVKRAELPQRQNEVQRWEDNKKRLGGMKWEGKPVLLDAFTVETKNSVCYYFAFATEAWEMLGDELYSAESSDPFATDGLPEMEGRDLDPELQAMLEKLNAERGGPPKIENKDLGELADLDVGGGAAPAAAKGGGGGGGKDALPAKTASSSSAVAKRTKIVVGVSVIAIIGAIVAALFMFVL